MSAPATVAVLDVGKTNVRLHAATRDGAILESLSVRNDVKPGPPWRHHGLEELSAWMFQSLAELARRHPIHHFVSCGHGSGGVLVGQDPDDGDGSALPMLDYEEDVPADTAARYAPLSGDFLDRGSAMMMKAMHTARQLYWMQEAEPRAFARGRWFLGLPQYWAWRLSGVAVSEKTVLAAQSHLWSGAHGGWSPIVARQGWQNLLPPISPAWAMLGPIRKELARRHGIRDGIAVLAGGHDSSLNVYRYQAAGLPDACVASTGTWIVVMCAATPVARLDERRGMTCNADVGGRPLGGALCMGGREFARIAGDEATANADAQLVTELIERRTYALPSFVDDNGQFPDSAGRGRFAGPPAGEGAERKALAVLYSALLTVECIDALGSPKQIVLDGPFLNDPLFASIVGALLPAHDVRYNLDANGTAAGAALLAGHESRNLPAPIALRRPEPYAGDISGLSVYAAAWRDMARSGSDPSEHTEERSA